MLADLFNAPGETTGTRTQGSSEAIMLGALSLKWKWRARREAAGKDTTRPNLVFGGDVHVVWEKFCRYFDVEPRIIPLQRDKYTIGPEDVEPHVDENTIGVAAVLGTTFTGHSDFVYAVAFSPKGDWYATASKDRTGRLVDAATGTGRLTFGGTDQEVLAVAVRPDGSQVVTGGLDTQLNWWDPKTAERTKRTAGPGVAAHEIAFDPKGALAVVAGGDATVRWYRPQTAAMSTP